MRQTQFRSVCGDRMEERRESEGGPLVSGLMRSYSLNRDEGDSDGSRGITSTAVYRRAEDHVDLVNHGRESEGEKKKTRAQWDNKIQFLLTLIGYAVGLGNVWRFSYLVNRNGGGAFLIPYFIMLFAIGIPLFYLELSLGQSLKLGPIKLWQKATPALGGIGYAMTAVSVYITLYYNVIVAWCIFYLVNSFTASLPWGLCFGHHLTGNITEDLQMLSNVSAPPESVNACISNPTRFYLYNTALQVSDSITEPGIFNWQMFLALAGAWLLVYICLFRGVETSGKAVYVTATFPFLILAVLFFRGVTLEGAGEGLRYLFIPRDGSCFTPSCAASMLYSPRVWLEAATQIFFSLGLAQGALISLSTYTTEKMKAVRQSVFVGVVNAFTSLVVAIVVYSVLGFQATQEGADLQEVFSAQGPGLSFVAFSEAILSMPISPLWAVLFFVMLVLLGLGSQFGSLEVIITVLYDYEIMQKVRKELSVAVICAFYLVVSIVFVFGNGVYLVQLLDQAASTLPLLFIAFFEVIAVTWVYGTRRYFDNIRVNQKAEVPDWKIKFWNVVWKYTSPLLMVVILFSSTVLLILKPLLYDVYIDFREIRDDYPVWARFLFGFITGSLMLIIPIYLVGMLSLETQARLDARDWCIDLLLGIRNRLLAAMYFCTWLFTCQCCRRHGGRTAGRYRLQ